MTDKINVNLTIDEIKAIIEALRIADSEYGVFEFAEYAEIDKNDYSIEYKLYKKLKQFIS